MKVFWVTAFSANNRTLGLLRVEAYTITYAMADAAAEIACTWNDNVIDQIQRIGIMEIES
jgi:hypothetical protein